MKHCLVLCGFALLTACSLPEMTPQIESTSEPTEVPFIVPETSQVTLTAEVTPEAVVITPKNAASLKNVNRVAAFNPQQLMWSADSSQISVSTQNSDAAGNQLFGISVMNSPDLSPLRVFSSQTDRVADISSDGRLAALVSLNSDKLTLIDLTADNTPLFEFRIDLINNASFSPDGTLVAVSSNEIWQVTLYSTEDGTEVKTLTGFETAAPVYSAGFKGSPQWMVWHARATIQLQEIGSGVLATPFSHQDFVNAYSMTEDGTILASVAAKYENDVPVPAVFLWDTTLGVEIQTLELTQQAQCLAFSPSGNLLAVGAGNQLEIWNVTDGTLLTSLEGHAETITSLAFSPDGKYLASAGMDNQLYLWQIIE